MQQIVNRIKLFGTLAFMLAVVAAVVYLCYDRFGKNEVPSLEDPASVAPGAPDDAIGTQLSPERQELFENLDAHMTQFLELYQDEPIE